MPFEILEPIAAGIVVVLLNKFLINYDGINVNYYVNGSIIRSIARNIGGSAYVKFAAFVRSIFQLH